MPRTRDKAGTREAILERAVDIASTNGLEGLTIGTLSADLGLSKSGLFAHFGSKEELQLATLQRAVERFIDTVVKPAYREPAGKRRLRALCDRYLAHLETGVFPGGCFFSASAAEFDGRPGAVRDSVQEGMQLWMEELERQAQAAGAEEPEQLAFELQALVAGANTRYLLFEDQRAFEQARRAIERLLP